MMKRLSRIQLNDARFSVAGNIVFFMDRSRPLFTGSYIIFMTAINIATAALK